MQLEKGNIMSIIRVRKDERYFTASNEPFVDKRLSWETRGLIGYLLTKPNNWEVRIDDLEKQSTAKLYKLRRMLAEARLYGYMNRIRIAKTDGTFDWITEVFESPSQNPNPSASVQKSTTGQSRVGLSTSGSATRGKPTDIVITDSTSTDSNVNERTALLATLYQANITAITPIMADTLQDAALEYLDATWYESAFKIAVSNNARNWKYVETILRNWKEKGRDWKPVYKRGRKDAPEPDEDHHDYEALRKQAKEELVDTPVEGWGG
jgi:DnaD/phage-associated family protein